MKLISWNVNGLRACVGKGFMDSFHALNADIFCIQETKMQPDQLDMPLEGYEKIFYSAEKKGYSGTAVFTRIPFINVSLGIGIEEYDREGRAITIEFENFYLVNCYTPNAQRELTRLPYRMRWEDEFRAYLMRLDERKPVVMCGDLNVAHREIDLKNPRPNRGNAGFTDEERTKFTALLEVGFVDTFRHLYPDATDAYSWWSYMGNARARNVGWRIDYFVVSERLKESIQGAAIHPQVYGSDHCPVELVLE